MKRNPLIIAALLTLSGPALAQTAPDASQLQAQQQLAAARARAAQQAAAAAAMTRAEPPAQPSDDGRGRAASGDVNVPENARQAPSNSGPYTPIQTPFTGIRTPWEPH